MTNNDDKLLVRFFGRAAKAEIPDGGFSRRVAESLHGRILRRVVVWRAFCVVAAVALSVGFSVWRAVAAWLADVAGSLIACGQPHSLLLHLAVVAAIAAAWAIREVLDNEHALW